MSRLNKNPVVKHMLARGSNRSLCGMTGIARGRSNHIVVCAWRYVTCDGCLKFRPEDSGKVGGK